MKFKFCGDADAPDWVLGEMATLSKISSVRVKLLLGQIVKGQLSGSVDYEKLAKVGSSSNLEVVDVEASIAALHYILTNAAKFDLVEPALARELQQLGIPKEHSDSICKSFVKEKEALQQNLVDHTLRLGSNQRLVCWQVDHELATRQSTQSGTTVRACITDVSTGKPTSALRMSEEQFQLLLHELKTARALMEQV